MTSTSDTATSGRKPRSIGPLVSTQWLEDHIDDPAVAVFEISIDPISSAAYTSGHVPGAQFVYWKDLLWHETDRQFASPALVAKRLGEMGVQEDTVIALVGDPFQFAAYAYWVLTMAGQEHRCLLVDGGRRTWLAENRPLTTGESTGPAGSVAERPGDSSSRIGREEILATLDGGGPLLLDMRSPEEYRGERVSPPWVAHDHGAERKGHIPGARHLYFEDLLDDNGTLLDSEALESRFDAVGATDGTEVVTYCRLSHRAALAWFVLTRVLDRSNVRVYDGSWTEWGSIVGVPVER
jgi:thiosulfate/3-mercaptopyruvate sulfurtransferase